MSDELTELQSIALEMTASFIDKLHRNGVSDENAIYEGYKFCEATLSGDKATCLRMDMAAALVGRAAVHLNIHPNQVKSERWQKG